MADIICRWRNGTPKTVVELVNSMPHEVMSSDRFRDIMSTQWDGDFFRTPYQLACQLGLYYESEDGYFHPRFDHDITTEEAEEYLYHWLPRYYIPNPYISKKGFNDIECPTFFLKTLYEYVKAHPNCNYHDACLACFKEEAKNNDDIIRNYINNYSRILTLSSEGKLNITDIDPTPIIYRMERSDKQSFFYNFNNDNIDTLKPIAESLQQIYYGAPGTGKSHRIKNFLEENRVPKENIFRTTFHPDSDYSTFVGAYKPSMEKPVDKIYAKGELISKLTEMKEGGVTYSPQKFGAKYWRSLKLLNLSDKKEILQACGMSDNYTVEFDKGMAVGEEYLACSNESRIIYSFVPQTFLNAYIQAYKKSEEKVYLIIEEINRGNCAQIFGDLFQLLDRDADGKSEYGIKADADLRAFLEEKLGEDNPGIKDGELCLPSNLYIFATMNTSDQSLFPIDSAFKRRWDWEYEPIKYNNTNWRIDIDGIKYSWVKFQKEVNNRILKDTGSEDKMMGDYFVNPRTGVISKKQFLNKILFYLWNDVCKDGDSDIFPSDDDFSFSTLYTDDSSKSLHALMENLGIQPEADSSTEESEENGLEGNSLFDSIGEGSNKIPKYSINGSSERYTTPVAVNKVIKDYVMQHEDCSVEDMIELWNGISERNNLAVAEWEPSPNDNQPFADKRRSEIKWGEDKSIWIINGWTKKLFNIFIRNVKDRLGIDIEEVK